MLWAVTACLPITPLITPLDGGPSPDFCAKWNPEFAFNGGRCCSRLIRKSRRKVMRTFKCEAAHPGAASGSYCADQVPEQKAYVENLEQNSEKDVLELIRQEMGSQGSQGQCSPNDGFLAFGRPIVPSAVNGIRLRTPERCAHFGTDPMIGMLEWLGRQVRERHSANRPEMKLLVGDIAAPRGGCLLGKSGRRGHSSHTSGMDADVGFLVVPSAPGRTSPDSFGTQFELQENWWFLKQIFQNPFACVKVVFLDRTLIRKIARSKLSREPEWEKYRRFVRHERGHRNHYHIRVGDGPGAVGCVSDPKPELESEEYPDDAESLTEDITPDSESAPEPVPEPSLSE